MTISRAAAPAPQTNLFAPATQNDWPKEIEKRGAWTTSLKTVEAAKDKEEGVKHRSKGKRGGDSSKSNVSTIAHNNPEGPTSPSRRGYQFQPSTRNPIMAGTMSAEDYRPGVKQVPAPKEKKQPKTHKVVNLNARTGHLQGGKGKAFEMLAGGAASKAPAAAADAAAEHGTGKGHVKENLFVRLGETVPPPQKISRRKSAAGPSGTKDPWEPIKNPQPVAFVDYDSKYPQRFQSTPARATHTFAEEPKRQRDPAYRISPPYSTYGN